MTEIEYITATNLAKVNMALAALSEVLPGFDGVTTEEKIRDVTRSLSEMKDELYAKIKLIG